MFTEFQLENLWQLVQLRLTELLNGGMTQEELVERSGGPLVISQQSISAYKLGGRGSRPSPEKLEALVKGVGLTTKEILAVLMPMDEVNRFMKAMELNPELSKRFLEKASKEEVKEDDKAVLTAVLERIGK